MDRFGGCVGREDSGDHEQAGGGAAHLLPTEGHDSPDRGQHTNRRSDSSKAGEQSAEVTEDQPSDEGHALQVGRAPHEAWIVRPRADSVYRTLATTASGWRSFTIWPVNADPVVPVSSTM